MSKSSGLGGTNLSQSWVMREGGRERETGETELGLGLPDAGRATLVDLDRAGGPGRGWVTGSPCLGHAEEPYDRDLLTAIMRRH